MAVVAVPNAAFAPDQAAVELAGAVVDTVGEVTPELVERVAGE